MNQFNPVEPLNLGISKLIRYVVPLEKSVNLRAEADTHIIIHSSIPEPKSRLSVEPQRLLEATPSGENA